MTEGREWSTILLFSLPIMGATLLQVLYNFADSVIVGNFVSPTALGAIGLVSSLIWFLNAIATSLGAGVNVAASQFYGAKKDRRIREIIAAAYTLGLLTALVMFVFCLLSAGPLIDGFLRAPEEMRAGSRAYFLIYGGGIIFQLVYQITFGLLRAHGDSKGALLFLLASALLNVAMDCFFVISLGWGITGAAGATVISQAGAALAAFLYMRRHFPDLLPAFSGAETLANDIRLLIRLSVPIALQTSVNSICFLILQRLINSFGTPSIEGYAAMLKIEQFAHIPSQSFNTAIASFAGQNIGAGKTDRARSGYLATLKMGIACCLAISVLVLIFDTSLLSLFAITGESLRRGREHLDILMFFIWINTITNITNGFLQGAGDVKLPAVSTFVNLAVRLSLSYLLALTPVGFRCYYVSMPPAWICQNLVVTLRYRSGKWKDYRIAGTR